ncbi:DDE superfamily endonuclease [Popillia japonica]|uniref:DDE superfamily endonuclease n=1 Tax=Popillia japonica TaxID=7064 RepID=A0AAW1JSK1_POPJA
MIIIVQRYNFPGIVGAIDCTHVAIIAPSENDHNRPAIAYYNRKDYYSLNVQMICDDNLRILNCNVRFPGSVHDSAIWLLSAVRRHLLQKFTRNELDSSWLIGDSGYGLQPWLLTPIENANPDSPEGRYTAQHIAARNNIERCFGVLKQRFRC